MKQMKNNSFKVLGTCKSGQNKNLVISLNNNNDIVIAQNFTVFDEIDNKNRTFVEKGSIMIKAEYTEDFVKLINELSKNFEKK